MSEQHPGPPLFITMEIRTRPDLVKLYPPQTSLEAAVTQYVRAKHLPAAPPVTRIRHGHQHAWRLDEHSGGRAMVLATDLATDLTATGPPVEPITLEGYARVPATTGAPGPSAAPGRRRRALVRVCDICHEDCTYLGVAPRTPGNPRPPRWACATHGPRPSPVLVRR